MRVSEFLQKSKRQRRALARRASRDKKFAKEYRKLTSELKVQVNKELRNLKRANLDYGNAINNIIGFTQTEYKKNRLLSPNELDNDLDAMIIQNEQAYKFLNSGWSNVKKARDTEQHRIDRLKEMEVLPENFTRRRSIEFLRWLGTEEVTAAIDEYGTSDVIVEIAYDVYKREGKDGLRTLSYALAEFLANKKLGFDTVMARRGIKIEDYLLKRDQRLRDSL